MRNLKFTLRKLISELGMLHERLMERKRKKIKKYKERGRKKERKKDKKKKASLFIKIASTR